MAHDCPLRQSISQLQTTELTALAVVGVTKENEVFYAHSEVKRRHAPPLLRALKSLHTDLHKLCRLVTGNIVAFPGQKKPPPH
jgi:hypothetical protein